MRKKNEKIWKNLEQILICFYLVSFIIPRYLGVQEMKIISQVIIISWLYAFSPRLFISFPSLSSTSRVTIYIFLKYETSSSPTSEIISRYSTWEIFKLSFYRKPISYFLPTMFEDDSSQIHYLLKDLKKTNTIRTL